MIDIISLEKRFSTLILEEKFQQLLGLFGYLRNKNKNCSYIYTMMQDHKESFDDTLLSTIFAEVLQVYTRIQQEQQQIGQDAMEQTSLFLQRIHGHEEQVHEVEIQDIEKLLDF